MSKIRIQQHRTFSEAKGLLTKYLQRAIESTTEEFRHHPESPGLHDEKLRSRHGLKSLRVNDDVRIIYTRLAQGCAVFLYVDYHDRAYRWADRARPQVKGDEFDLVLHETQVEIEHKTIVVPNTVKASFSHCSPEYLISLGVPAALIEYVRNAVTDENIEELMGQIPDTAWENLDAVRLSKPPPHTFQDPAEYGTKLTLCIPPEERVLTDAVTGAFDQWSIFLHPSSMN